MTYERAHRQYPPPASPWVMEQTWENLLFAHWPVKAEVIKSMIPSQLTLDTFDGTAWIGLVPFVMPLIRIRGVPPIPGFRAFPEVNLRTYVRYNGKPGVYFFSLDAGHWGAVLAARCLLHLPYYKADFDIQVQDSVVRYTVKRTHQGERPWCLSCTYGPVSDVYESKAGTLDAWFTDRYYLFQQHRDVIYCGGIDHPPWPLQQAEADFHFNTMFDLLTLPTPATKPELHFAKRLHTHLWPIIKAT